MALIVNDRVRESTTVVGTGTATLLGAITGYQAFSVIGNGNTCYYTIADQIGANWEVGIGTYTSSGNTLARTTVLKSSNSNNLVSFTAGTKDVFVTYPAETAVSGGGGGTYPTVQPSLNLDFANSKQLDPRITFVRNSTATYYDGQTSALAEQNLLLQSQTFATTWVTSNTTLGSLTTAPDGTTTAYPLTASAINGTLLQTFTATANAYTFSIYIQRVTGTGNIDITVDGTTYATQTTTGTWTRFNITTTPSAGSKTAGIRLAVSGDVVNIWGAQLEQRSSATAYTPTTTAAITNYIPVLMTAPANVARFDCDPITRNSLGLLIEESRTNLLRYSVGNGASWNIRTGALVTTANAQVAPDGTITATQLTKTAITDTVWQQAFTAVVGVTYTASAYFLKTSSVNVIEFAIRLSFIGGDYSGYLSFDTLTGNYVVRSGALANITIVDCGRYWRILITSSGTTSGTLSDSVIIIRPTTGVIVGGFNTTAIGSCIFWGAQLEAGAFSTSYIPTVASTVTRAADQASMTGTNFSSWYNQAQGTLYAESDDNGVNNNGAATLYNIGASNNNAIAFYGNGTLNTARLLVRLNVVYVINTSSSATTQPIKQAASFKDGAVSCTANGILFVTNVNVNIPHNLDTLYIGYFPGTASYLTGHIRKLSYYPVALSSSNLVALTS
jgi:hypothetical protein